MRSLKKAPHAEIVLPIASFLDVSFQMLFFFIFNFNPATVVEGQMELSLPAPAPVKGPPNPKDQVNPPGADKEPEMEAELTVVVRTQRSSDNYSGNISAILIQREKGGETEINPPTTKALLDYLTKERDKLNNKNDIKVQGDSQLKWARVVEAMDMCRQAGFTNVGFSPPPDYRPGS
jgi:biopolymer transport protein ExbD